MSARALVGHAVRRREVEDSDVWMISSKVIHHRLRLARCLMVPRFSLSARSVRDAVHNTRAPYTRSQARTLGFSCASTPPTERIYLPQYSDGTTGISALRAGEPAPSVKGQVSIVSHSFYGAQVRRPILREFIMTSRRREIALGD